MNRNNHFSSRLLTLAGGLMTVSGVLMALIDHLAVGGVFWAAASCMFFTAYHFYLAENRKNRENTEGSDDE